VEKAISQEDSNSWSSRHRINQNEDQEADFVDYPLDVDEDGLGVSGYCWLIWKYGSSAGKRSFGIADMCETCIVNAKRVFKRMHLKSPSEEFLPFEILAQTALHHHTGGHWMRIELRI
jgi:hypothetical protein